MELIKGYISLGNHHTSYPEKMSHIISNSYVESDMADRFLCLLYRDERNYQEVLANRMDPIEIWKNLKYRAYGKQVGQCQKRIYGIS